MLLCMRQLSCPINLNLALKLGISDFVFVSSVATVGSAKNKQVLNEADNVEEGRQASNYATSKYLAELEVWRGWAEGLNAVIVNPSLVLGPGDLNKSSTQIFKYINEENSFYTDGIVNYVDVRDVAAATFQLYENKVFGERFILSAGALPYGDFFRKIAEAMNKKPPHIKANKTMIRMAFYFSKIQAFLFKKQPLVTRETLQVSKRKYVFDNSKVVKALDFN